MGGLMSQLKARRSSLLPPSGNIVPLAPRRSRWHVDRVTGTSVSVTAMPMENCMTDLVTLEIFSDYV